MERRRKHVRRDATIQTLARVYLEEKTGKVKNSTLKCYQRNIRCHILPKLGGRVAANMTVEDIDDYLEAMQENFSPKLTREVGALLLALLRLAGVNFTGEVALPKIRQKNVEVFTEPELKQMGRIILRRPDETGLGILLTAYTGIRLGELCGLKWQDVNVDTGMLHVQRTVERIAQEDGTTCLTAQTPKTDNSNRWIPIPQEMLRVLKGDHRPPDAYLLTGGEIMPDPRTYQYRYKALLKRCGVCYRNFHALRHPYVKHTTKIFSLRLMNFQAQAYPDARRKTRGACQLHRGGQSKSLVRLLCNRKQFSCLPPQSKISRILYAISIRLSGYTSTRSISSSASSVVSVSASKSALDASLRLSCRACSSCFCFACANTAA